MPHVERHGYSLSPGDSTTSVGPPLEILLQDIRYAARKLLRSAGFTTIVVCTLALAIGATTAVFSIVNGVLLKPLPFRQPERLIAVGVASRTPGQMGPIS